MKNVVQMQYNTAAVCEEYIILSPFGAAWVGEGEKRASERGTRSLPPLSLSLSLSRSLSPSVTSEIVSYLRLAPSRGDQMGGLDHYFFPKGPC